MGETRRSPLRGSIRARSESEWRACLATLSSAWTKLQDVVNEKENAENEPESVLKNINEAIVLLGQVINKFTYERRLSILAGLNDMKQSKSLLKDNLEDLNTETKFLFGETF